MDNSKGNIHNSNGSVKRSRKEMLLFLIPIFAILVLTVSLTAANTVFAQTNSSTAQQQQSSSNTSDKSGTIKSVQTDVQGKKNLDSNVFPGISNILSSIPNMSISNAT
jgi:hypothetical protein